MRKHQRKIVNDIRRVYQSNDPLRWFYLSHRFGVHRAPTRREWRLLMRRVTKTVGNVAATITEAFQNMSRVFSRVGRSMAEMLNAARPPEPLNMPPVSADILSRNTIKIDPMNPRHVAIDPAAIGADRSVATIHGHNGGMVILDEAANLDDATIDALNESINEANGGRHEKTV